MKTAMQILIDEIKEAVPYLKMSIYQPNFDKSLEKEKEQIIDAHNKGIWPEEKVFDDGEEYYNETYKAK